MRHNPTVACAWVGRGVIVVIVKSREWRSRGVVSVNSATGFCHRVKCGIVSAVPVSTFTTLISKLLELLGPQSCYLSFKKIS